MQEDWDAVTTIPRMDQMMLGFAQSLPFPEGTDPEQVIDKVYVLADMIDRRAPQSEIDAVEPGLALPPGHIRWGKKTFLVGTASTPLKVEQLQPVGKKMMNALDWVRGARIEAGTAFE